MKPTNNDGGPGVDVERLQEYEKDLKNNITWGLVGGYDFLDDFDNNLCSKKPIATKNL